MTKPHSKAGIGFLLRGECESLAADAFEGEKGGSQHFFGDCPQVEGNKLSSRASHSCLAKTFQTMDHSHVRISIALLTVGLVFLASGCSSVNVAEQRLVSKGNMVFAESSVFGDSSSLHSVVEPGTAGSGGGQAGGCTSCK